MKLEVKKKESLKSLERKGERYREGEKKVYKKRASFSFPFIYKRSLYSLSLFLFLSLLIFRILDKYTLFLKDLINIIILKITFYLF